jgi:hypothetical protein
MQISLVKLIFCPEIVWGPFQAVFRPFRKHWFALAIADPAAMHLVLSNAAMHRRSLRGTQDDDIIGLRHSTAAIASIVNRIPDPVEGITDKIVGAVLGVCCSFF